MNNIETNELLTAINLRNLPIDWQALASLGHMINRLQDNPYGASGLAAIEPPEDVYPAIAMVASVIANKNNPAIPLSLPSNADIQKIKPFLLTLEKWIEKVSPRLSKKFVQYCEKRGQDMVKGAALGLVEIVEIFTPFEKPKEQFVKELTAIYNNLQKPVIQEGIIFDDELSIEDKIENLFDHLQGESGHKWFNDREFALTTKLTKRLKFPPASLSSGDAGVVGAEFMAGIESFLRQKGIREIKPAPQAKEFDLFDWSTWKRGLAEIFVPEKIEKVKKMLPEILMEVERILPESNSEFKKKIYSIAEMICMLNESGVSPETIAKHIFKKQKVN